MIQKPLLAQDEDLTILDDWLIYTDASNALYHHLVDQARGLLDQRHQAIPPFTSQTAAQQWVASRQQVLHAVVGPFPERTPLHPVVTGTLQRTAFRVEKVIYESQPGFYVTAALFIPNGLTQRAPAIVFCSGHDAKAFRSTTYQTIILNLVRKGFIVLAFDPVGQGERLQYLAEDGASNIGGPTHEHSYPGAQYALAGTSIANTMIWDGIRSVDYLLTRPEVDPHRIGITGRSGGGTQAAYIAAMDPRILAAAPENYITNFKRLLEMIGPQDAEQNFFQGLAHGIDHADLLAVRAPKPTLLITTTRDFFSIQGARETYAELQSLYTTLGYPDRITMVEDDFGHGSTRANREALYRFFQHTLNEPGAAADEPVTLFPQDALRITDSGQVLSSRAPTTIFDLLQPEAARLSDTLQSARQLSARHRTNVVAQARNRSGYRAPPEQPEALFAGRYRRPGYTVEKYLLPGEIETPLPFLAMVPEGPGPHPAVLYLDPEGKAAEAASGSAMELLVRQGYLVLAPDLPGLGELGPGTLRGDSYAFDIGVGAYNIWFLAMQVARSLVGIRAGEVVRLAHYLRRRADVDPDRVTALARGNLGPVLLHAAAFEPIFERLILIDAILSYQQLFQYAYYQPALIHGTVPGALPAYDLPDLAAALAPRSLLWINPLDEMALPADRSRIDAQLSYPYAVYTEQDARNAFQVVSGVDKVMPVVLDWLSRD